MKTLVEGANAELLGIDFEIYPFITSLNCTVEGFVLAWVCLLKILEKCMEL